MSRHTVQKFRTKCYWPNCSRVRGFFCEVSVLGDKFGVLTVLLAVRVQQEPWKVSICGLSSAPLGPECAFRASAFAHHLASFLNNVFMRKVLIHFLVFLCGISVVRVLSYHILRPFFVSLASSITLWSSFCAVICYVIVTDEQISSHVRVRHVKSLPQGWERSELRSMVSISSMWK